MRATRRQASTLYNQTGQAGHARRTRLSIGPDQRTRQLAFQKGFTSIHLIGPIRLLTHLQMCPVQVEPLRALLLVVVQQALETTHPPVKFHQPNPPRKCLFSYPYQRGTFRFLETVVQQKLTPPQRLERKKRPGQTNQRRVSQRKTVKLANLNRHHRERLTHLGERLMRRQLSSLVAR